MTKRRTTHFGKLVLLLLAGIGTIYLFLLLTTVKLPDTKESVYPQALSTDDSSKRSAKIIIFSSKGGGGHTSVSEALQEYLGQDHSLAVVNVFTDVLGSLDVTQQLTNRLQSGEKVYDYTLKRKWYPLTTLMYKVGSWYFNMRRASVKRLFSEYIERHNPDMVISVVPIVNGPLLEATREHNIPLLLLPTDLDATSFLQGVDIEPDDTFQLALSFDDADIMHVANKHHIPANLISTVGFPVKSKFLNDEQLATKRTPIRRKLRIPRRRPIVLLMMGSLGSRDIVTFTQALAQVSSPMHLIIALGRSEHLRDALEKIEFPSRISRSIIGFTKQVDELMAISDLLITKSGTVSLCEGIYMGLPIILDATTKPLPWEQLNHRFVKKHRIGTSVTNTAELVERVNRLLADRSRLRAIKEVAAEFTTKDPRVEIQQLITRMLADEEEENGDNEETSQSSE